MSTAFRTRGPGLLAAMALVVPLLLGTSGTSAASAVHPADPGPVPVAATPPVRPQPVTGTHLLDHGSYLAGLNDPAWYEANIPFVDLPDKTIQDVYYYRWRVWKEHLRYTNPTDGWVSTEFLDCCSYAAPYQAVNAAAGHQISEGRWLRDPEYVDDYTRFWLTGPGSGPKPATDAVNADTTDWAHEYSFWLASAAYGRAQVSGDLTEVTKLLPQLERQYRGWDKQFNPDLGLYWSVPVWDAMELSASSYRSSDPYHGGAGYRPTLNSYQYGDAMAISRIAALVHDRKTQSAYARRATDLKAAMQRWLWDPARGFYYAMARDNNPQHALLDTREEIGFIPWQFGAAQPGDSTAWAQLKDPQGFAAPYGPTTAERRSPLFMFEAGNCCRWDGPSWPFATAQTLTGLANQLDDYPAQTTVTKQDYADALTTYARTQYRDGKPYVAEAHDPDRNSWIYDGFNHSEDYNHSTFNDLVLSGLLGLRPQTDASLRIQPLVPAGWDHYAVENVPYHGHNVSVLWDRDGTHYKQGAGMKVYLDGRLVRSSATLRDLTVPVPTVRRTPKAAAAAPQRQVNDAANPLRQGYPKPITSYTWQNDNPWSGIDGKVWFTEVPENTRWTNYSSPNAHDYYGVDFGVATPVGHIRWYGYDDGGGVRPAADYRVQYLTAGGWADVPGQTRAEARPVGNGPNDITFPVVTTTQVRLLFTNPPGAYVGVTELQSWSTSSADAAVTVGPANSAGAVSVQGPTAVTVTVRNTTGTALTRLSVSLALPAGWTAVPAAQGPPRDPPRRLQAGDVHRHATRRRGAGHGHRPGGHRRLHLAARGTQHPHQAVALDRLPGRTAGPGRQLDAGRGIRRGRARQLRRRSRPGPAERPGLGTRAIRLGAAVRRGVAERPNRNPGGGHRGELQRCGLGPTDRHRPLRHGAEPGRHHHQRLFPAVLAGRRPVRLRHRRGPGTGRRPAGHRPLVPPDRGARRERRHLHPLRRRAATGARPAPGPGRPRGGTVRRRPRVRRRSPDRLLAGHHRPGPRLEPGAVGRGRVGPVCLGWLRTPRTLASWTCRGSTLTGTSTAAV